MKFKKHVSIVGLSLALFFGGNLAVAQDGKFALGVDYGYMRLQYQPLYAHLDEANFISYATPATPKNFRGLVELAIKSKTRLRLAAGYGTTQPRYVENFLEFEMAIAGQQPKRISAETQIRASGILVESALLWQLPIRFPQDAQRRLSLHAGAGVGFYSFRFKTSGWWEQHSNPPSPATDFRRDLNLPDSEMYGLSQFILATVDFRFISKAVLTFEYSRQGFFDLRFNKTKYANEAERTTYARRQYRSRLNSDHYGLTIGLKWNFGKV